MIDVLIVDDDNLVRKGLMTAMPWEALGMRVVGEAANGEKALEFLEERRVDLLLTDLAMPVMSGIELIRIVRKRHPEVAVAVLTLHQDFEYVQEALRLGAIDYIAKFQLEKERFDEVLGRIRERILDEKRKRAEEGGSSEVETMGFYDRNGSEPDVPEESVRAFRSERREADDPETEEAKAELHSFRWLHDDRSFQQLLQRLYELRLPVPKLMQLLYGCTMDWNRLYRDVAQAGMALPDTFAGWREVVDWLASFRETALSISGRLLLSQEVSGSIMAAVKIVHDELELSLYAIDVAKRVNLSRSYFNHCFKEIVGYSFNEYLRKVRIDKAREYLVQTMKPVQWVAEHTGYSDEKYFSRVFREQTGALPSEYRQKHGRG